MIAAPAPGLEHVGEVLQPLFGERAPARRNVTAASAVLTMCHEPARKERTRTRDATHTNQFRRDEFILWKSFVLSSSDAIFVTKISQWRGNFSAFAVNPF